MITRYYADVLDNGDVRCICRIEDPDEGPPEIRHCEGVAIYLGTEFTWDAPTDTCKPTWPEGATAIVWVDTALADRIAAAIARTYADIDAVVWDAVGNRTEEYKEAETDARSYKVAGYADPVPPSVACYALHNPTGEERSGQWAADDIIARADAFAGAKLAMRATRFASQSAMRTAATDADLSAAVSAWNDFIASIRSQLGLPPTK
jgi:hypothetical protein